MRHCRRESAGERVVDVGHGDDSGGEGDGGLGQFFGIAGAVPAFVVVGGDLGAHGEEGIAAVAGENFFQHPVTEVGVALDDSAFAIGEATGLAEDGVGDADLADVVHRAGDAEFGSILH